MRGKNITVNQEIEMEIPIEDTLFEFLRGKMKSNTQTPVQVMPLLKFCTT